MADFSPVSLIYVIIAQGTQRISIPIVCGCAYLFHVLYSINGFSALNSFLLTFLFFEVMLRVLILALLAGL